MSITNKSTQGRFASLPHAVETGLRELGRNLRTARLRRNISIEDVAQKLGMSRYAIADAEQGKPSTGVAVYAGLLWTYGLLDQLGDLADPARDEEGLALSARRERARVKRPERLSNDF